MDALKQKAAEAAIECVEDGMLLGLGTGSTTARFIELLGQSIKDGLNVKCVPTSEATRVQAEKLGIPLTTLDENTHLDLTVDGADEIDEDLCLIKGGGGALLREKIVAMSSSRLIIIADQSKLVKTLGKFPLPIEVVPFGCGATKELIKMFAEDVGCTGDITLRKAANGTPFITDNGNYILDCAFGAIQQPDELEENLYAIPGVIETGLFLGIADFALIGTDTGVDVIGVSDEDMD